MRCFSEESRGKLEKEENKVLRLELRKTDLKRNEAAYSG